MFHRDRLSTRVKPDPATVRHMLAPEAPSATRHTLAKLSCKDLLPDSANGLGCLVVLRIQIKSDSVQNSSKDMNITRDTQSQMDGKHNQILFQFVVFCARIVEFGFGKREIRTAGS